jgi:transposase-like protein
MENKYLKRGRISEEKFRLLLKYFSKDFSATQTADLASISLRSVTDIYQKIRARIVALEIKQDMVDGEIEVDESYFGAQRIRGKRGRGASGKTPVVGLLKRDGKVYTQVINNCSREALLPIIKGKVLEGSTVYTDGWKSYDSLVLNGYKHYRIHHSENEFARGKNHVNGIESFWSYTKRRLRKFNGIRKDKFLLHLKESQFRWNNRGGIIYSILLKELRRNPL